MTDEEIILTSPIAVDELIAHGAAFLYQISTSNDGGDVQDLPRADTEYFLYLAEHQLVYMGILPKDWEYRMSPPEED